MPGPSFRSELRRAFNAYNLTVGFLAAVILGIVAAAAAALTDLGSPIQLGAISGAVAFVLITLLHALAHSYFGHRLERGLQAAEKGDWRRAEKLLEVLDRQGMDHYDEDGTAAAALAHVRRQLQ